MKGRPIIISSVTDHIATPEQERTILDLLAKAHEAGKRKREQREVGQ